MRENTLASRLRTARKLRELTQVQLAELSGVRQSDISKIERGETLRTTSAVELAKALDVSPVWLATGEGEMLALSQSASGDAGNTNALLVGLNKRVPRLAWDEVQGFVKGMFTPTQDRYEVVAARDVSPRCFLVEISGDSMVSSSSAESIPQGSMLLCDPDRAVVPGNIVVAIHPRTGEPVARQLVMDGGLLFLKAHNPAYQMLEIAGPDAVVARAIEVITRRAL